MYKEKAWKFIAYLTFFSIITQKTFLQTMEKVHRLRIFLILSYLNLKISIVSCAVL